MKHITILLLLLGILVGCTDSAELSGKDEIHAQNTIQHNRVEAQHAQEEYKKLQKAHTL